MKRQLTAALLATAVAFAAPAIAQDGQGAYVGASFGFTDISVDECIGDCDKTDTGFKVFGGYMFTPYIGAELSYQSFGKDKINVGLATTSVNAEAKSSGFGAFLIGQYPIENWRLFGKIGFGWLDNEVTVTVPTAGAASESDEMEARGTLAGLVLTATRLELLEGGVDFEFSGLLTLLLPPDRFVMDDGRIYTVDQSTYFDPAIGGYSGLAVGQYLEVKARRGPSGANLVVEVEYEGDMQSGQGYRELEGVVQAISSTELQFEGLSPILITPATEFEGDADSWQDVIPGWWAEAYVLLDELGDLTAIEVRADDREAATTGGQDYEPQQALVVTVPGGSADAIAARFGAQVVGRVGGLGALLWFPEPLSDDLLAALTADPEVAAVEPNYFFQDPESVRRRYPTVDRTPSSEKLVGQAAVHQVGLPAAHQLADGGGIVVVPREVYAEVPLDPRFVGWGGEDISWAWASARSRARGSASAWSCSKRSLPRRMSTQLPDADDSDTEEFLSEIEALGLTERTTIGAVSFDSDTKAVIRQEGVRSEGYLPRLTSADIAAIRASDAGARRRAKGRRCGWLYCACGRCGRLHSARGRV